MIWRFALLVVVTAVAAASAAPRVVRGVVVERDAGLPIGGATVLAERGSVAITDVDGIFAIEVLPADRELTIAASGYATLGVRVPRDDSVLRIALVASASAEVIEVSGKAPEQTNALSYALTADEIRAIPGAGNDILRALTILPGIARLPYSFGGVVARGMSPRDTSVFLDGVEVPIAFHFGGVVSFYPGGMLDDVQVAGGGYDASYGRTQGALVTLTTREPRTDRWRMGGSIGLLDSSVQVEGPLPRGGGVIAGLRRSYLDAIARPFVPADTPLPSYWDYQLRTSWGDPRKRGRITPMVFGSIDQLTSSEATVTSTFVRVAAPYHRGWGETTLHVVPWIGANALVFDDKAEDQSLSRPMYPGGVRGELVRDTSWGHVRGGLELDGGHLAGTSVEFRGDVPETLEGTSTLTWLHAAAWGELRLVLDEGRLSIKPGVRAELYGTTGELVVDPRLNLAAKLTETTTLRQSIGRFHQPPTPGDVDPQNGNPQLDSSYVDQLTLGVDTTLPRDITASVTGFYHHGIDFGVRVRDVADRNLGGLGPTFELLVEEQLGFALYRENVGRARSLGLEVLLKRNVGPWFALASYTLAIAQRTDDPRITDLAARGGAWRPFELDQRHNLQLAVSRRWEHWRIGGRFQLVSGNPYSPTTQVTEDFDVIVDPWGGRLPPFVSLDLRVDRRWHRCWGDINLYIDIQNALNRRNVEGREFHFDIGRDADIRGLPIIPFIGVEFLPVL